MSASGRRLKRRTNAGRYVFQAGQTWRFPLHGRRRPTIIFITLECVALAAAAVVAVLASSDANWDIALFTVLLAFSIASDLFAATTSAAKISGSFLSLVLAMVFLGGTPACLIGVATIIVGWLRWRDSWSGLLNNLVAYAWFPLMGGIVFTEVSQQANLSERDGFFYLLTFVVFVLALAIELPDHRGQHQARGGHRRSASWCASW